MASDYASQRAFPRPVLPRDERGLVWAADLVDRAELFRILNLVTDLISMVKVGHSLLWSCGVGVIAEIKDQYDVPVLADVKLCDIPAMISKGVSILYGAGADGVMVVGLAGEESVRAAMDVDRARMVFVLTELTHSSGLIDEDMADASARMAREVGAYGIQAPGTRPDRVRALRKIVGDRLKIIACGIGVQGGKLGSAVTAGGNYEIVGRSITCGPDPRGAAKQALKRICAT